MVHFPAAFREVWNSLSVSGYGGILTVTPDLQSQLDKLFNILQQPVWHRWDFWLLLILGVGGTAVSIAGLVYSLRAFREAEQAKNEARKAKTAAIDAGKTVRAQSVAIELGEISMLVQRLDQDIRYIDARNLLSDITRRLRKALSPFAQDSALKSLVSGVKEALDNAQKSLEKVRPTDLSKENETPMATFYGIEGAFRLINDLVADLLGLIQNKTFDFGDSNAD
jgi:hypothetical protein